MTIAEKIRVAYPLPLAKLYEAMQLETEPRHRVRKLVDLFEGMVHYLALLGLADYVYYKLAVPSVEKVRSELRRPSLGSWVKLLVSVIEVLLSHDSTFWVTNPRKHIYKDDSILKLSRILAQILEKPSQQFQTIKQDQFLNLVVEFRNKKFGHGTLFTSEANLVNEPLRAALEQWLEEISIFQQRHLVSIASVEWQDPHFTCTGTNLNFGVSLYPFSLDRNKPVRRDKVYLHIPTSDEFLLLYPFFVFDNDTRLLYTYSEISNQEKLILRCPYETPGSTNIYYMDLDPSVVIGTEPGEVIISSTDVDPSDVSSEKVPLAIDASPREENLGSGDEKKVTSSPLEVVLPDYKEDRPVTEQDVKPALSPSTEVIQKPQRGTGSAILLAGIEKALRQAPVMGQFHPLVSLCLPDDTEIISEPEKLVEELDSPAPHTERLALITRVEPKLRHRFISLSHLTCPASEIINQNLAYRIKEARQTLLTSHKVPGRIISDIRERSYQTVFLLMVDGLSYADIVDWPEQAEPCFIDGPSITFSRTVDGTVNPQVGFPSMVGAPALARQMIDAGLPRSRGFSYWEREQNDVSELLFQGIPLEKVSNLSDSFEKIEKLDLKGVYVQMIREGLDGLAHSRREVSEREIKATVKAVHQDFRSLVELLIKKKVRGVVYLVADHGILWKNQHKLHTIEGINSQHPRYATSWMNTEFATEFSTDAQKFYLWHYPYLGKQIRSNDSGVHGGLSYWESIVPFIRVEVDQ